jgi:hypothetical protein
VTARQTLHEYTTTKPKVEQKHKIDLKNCKN